MGWLTMSFRSMGGHTTAKAYLDAQLTYTRQIDDGTAGLRVLASCCSHNRTYYAAVQIMKNGIGGEVIAIICKVLWNPHSKTGEQFGYKDMSETMGPYEASCPQYILDLLTPTDNLHAIGWRQRCVDNLKLRRRKLGDGDRVRLDVPLTFTDGHVGDEFVVERRGRKVAFCDPITQSRYRISRFMDLQWQVIPQTKIYKTIFV